MLEYLIILLLLSLSLTGHGFFITKLIIINYKNLYFGDIILISYFSLSFLLTFLHFFLPISHQLNIIIHAIGILLFIINFKEIKKYFDKSSLLILVILSFLSIIFFYEHKPNEDFGFYHLPYIVNFTSEKVIFGLNSLQLSQGYNSMWLNLHSSLYLFKNDYKHLYILNSIFFITVAFLFIKEIISNFNKKGTQNKLFFLFSYIFLLFFIIKFSRINSYGIDVPGNFLAIISILYFLKFVNLKENRLLFFQLFVISIILSITIRITNLPLILLLFYSLFLIKFNKEIFFSKFALLVSLFGTFWLIQQFIYTGCILIPSNISCFLKPSWFDPNYLDNFKNILYVNHSYASYKGPLGIKEYHENFNWVPTWFKRNSIELTEYFLAFLLPILLLKIFSKGNEFIITKKKYEFFIIIFSLLTCTILWFYNSPVIRMGNHFIMLLVLFLLLVLNFFRVFADSIYNKKIYIIIFTLSVTFFVSKNISRIKNIEFEKNIWPNFKKVNFKSEKKYGLNMKQIINGSDPQTVVCWDVPFICRATDFNDIYIDRSQLGYLFIYKFKK